MSPKKIPATALTIGLRIKEKREASSVSQTDLGAALAPPVSYQMVWKYENGKGRLSAEQLAQIATILHTDVAFFYQ